MRSRGCRADAERVGGGAQSLAPENPCRHQRFGSRQSERCTKLIGKRHDGGLLRVVHEHDRRGRMGEEPCRLDLERRDDDGERPLEGRALERQGPPGSTKRARRCRSDDGGLQGDRIRCKRSTQLRMSHRYAVGGMQ
jgi:hypothetical protein